MGVTLINLDSNPSLHSPSHLSPPPRFRLSGVGLPGGLLVALWVTEGVLAVILRHHSVLHQLGEVVLHVHRGRPTHVNRNVLPHRQTDRRRE